MIEELTVFPETALEIASQVRGTILDHQAFEQPVTVCSLAKCKATCCYDGVYLGAEETEIVKVIVDRESVKGTWDKYGLKSSTGESLTVENVLTETDSGRMKTQVRDAEGGELPTEFPKHFNRTRCVFLDNLGRCGLQRLAMEEGDKHPWFYKPITCWIHPIALAPPKNRNGRVKLTLFNSENDPHKEEGYPGFCSVTPCGKIDVLGVPAKDALGAEIEYLESVSGRPLTKELRAETL